MFQSIQIPKTRHQIMFCVNKKHFLSKKSIRKIYFLQHIGRFTTKMVYI